EHCSCGCHDHHGHHHADEVFVSWGKETTKTYTEEEIKSILTAFDEDPDHCGMILRSKGIVPAGEGKWIHFDYVPGEHDVRFGCASLVGKLCVIGVSLNEDHLAQLFGV
ncbi:MAG: cobalamin biosynthesis protein CobW, partial [Clostridia bacterium]|nr:cobalamin biosynthesis protein CobW [Clostridia bacterium]